MSNGHSCPICEQESTRLREQRDQARGIAVQLEGECADLRRYCGQLEERIDQLMGGA